MRPAVIPRGGEWVFQTGEDPDAVMGYRRRLAVPGLWSRGDHAAVCNDDRLMTQAYAEGGDALTEVLMKSTEKPAASGVPGPGRSPDGQARIS